MFSTLINTIDLQAHIAACGICPDNDSYSRIVCLVFDFYSQLVLITEHLKIELGLLVIDEGLLLIKTFGQSDVRLRSCEIV